MQLTQTSLMELLYLICSIFSSFFTSLLLSLLLPFRLLLRHLLPQRTVVDGASSVFLYQGTVWHERRRPVHHSFKYPVRYALVDLDHHSLLNHLSADEARRFAETNGSVFLLTIPPSIGYEQNPLSVYYCYNVEGSTQDLKSCIAEVTNTPWGERVLFVFDPKSDVVAKPLHVSPFMDMLGNWSIKTNVPGDNLLISISVQHPELGEYFSASLIARRVSSLCSADHAVFFWLMPHKVALWIYWHAFKLWWKNVQFIQHPRYSNPAYREEALARDGKPQCCRGLQVEGSDSCLMGDLKVKNHQFTWIDAKWPWC